MRARVIRFAAPGGPDVLKMESVTLPPPAAGEALVRQTAIGLNYLDVYHRSGAYPLPLPSGVGSEAAGVVEEIGPGVSLVSAGDRVVYAGGPPGAYASHRNVAAERLVVVPDGVTDELAAAVMLKGMTVEYLLNRCHAVQSGEYVLFHAAAGGVGLLAGEWGHHLGATMIGVAGGVDKCRLAREHGYADVIDRTSENVIERVNAITDGAGVPVVYDSVGKATFDVSIACLAPRGLFVSFGTTTGPPPPVEAGTLQKHGSLYFTRPTLVTYTARREELVASAIAVFDMVTRGAISVHIGARYALADATRAHADLEAGKTVGSSLLLP
ncbi:MAG: quinone oxidoreductase [Acidobacteria bacterium]|nr:quinone oxidoreductase [Acidobacteriota bacterium]